MLQKTYITLLFLLVASCAFAQKTERDYLRSGNKLYNAIGGTIPPIITAAIIHVLPSAIAAVPKT